MTTIATLQPNYAAIALMIAINKIDNTDLSALLELRVPQTPRRARSTEVQASFLELAILASIPEVDALPDEDDEIDVLYCENDDFAIAA